MSDQLPPPEFDSSQYERPNQEWICGCVASGEFKCRLGPDPRGKCRSFECQPSKISKEGEPAKFRCNRPASEGGPCKEGPTREGQCCRVRCQPVRSLRSRRKLISQSVFSFTAGVLLILLFGPHRFQWISPGDVSSHHSGEAFHRMSAAENHESNCNGCHEGIHSNPKLWLPTAWSNSTRSLSFHHLLNAEKTRMTTIDAACQKCHQAHDFHQPNVIHDPSCSSCHIEHQGIGAMKPVRDEQCIACHGNEEVMMAAFEKGKSMPLQAFKHRVAVGTAGFVVKRPEQGYTRVIHSFGTDHPEFQVHQQHVKDPNTLKFNHHLHLGENIPKVNGRKLDCSFCHQPDLSGAYFQEINFEKNCSVCHALQFDEHNPELHVPHADPSSVRAFLRSLSTQYADLGRRKKGLQQTREVDAFVSAQMQQLKMQYSSGETLEDAVFFSTNRKSEQERTSYNGCQLCHEISSPAAGALPVVTEPIITERWLFRGRFHHEKHSSLNCTHCHAAPQSRETADLILPGRDLCVTCHSPQGGISHSCITCHNFHNIESAGTNP